LNGTTGAISGTVTAAGASSFTVVVTDSETPTAKTATANLSITITSKIPHVVVILPENRTPDNLFQDPIFVIHAWNRFSKGGDNAARTIAAAVRARKLEQLCKPSAAHDFAAPAANSDETGCVSSIRIAKRSGTSPLHVK
jgi:hypothetical protein